MGSPRRHGNIEKLLDQIICGAHEAKGEYIHVEIGHLP